MTVKGKPEPSPVATVPAAPPREKVGGKVRSLAETVALAEEAFAGAGLRRIPAVDRDWNGLQGGPRLGGLPGVGRLERAKREVCGGDDTAKRWAGFEPSTIGLAALFSRAESAGWVSPWAKARERKGKALKACQARIFRIGGRCCKTCNN